MCLAWQQLSGVLLLLPLLQPLLQGLALLRPKLLLILC
jgi:hypothetical protein